MKLASLLVFPCALAVPHAALAGELKGPARFCGYSPIIDLLPGERVKTLQGGIHGGTFRWFGLFGMLEVLGTGIASPPTGWMLAESTPKGHERFTQRRISGRYTVALWNRKHGAAYFSSARPITARQIAAIDRVDLFEEGQDPTGCKLRTVFSWP